MGDFGLCLRFCEERDIDPQWMEEKASYVVTSRRTGSDGTPRVAAEPPQKKTNVWNVVPAAPAANAPHLNGARQLVESAADSLKLLHLVKSGGKGVTRAEMVKVLGCGQPQKIFHRSCVPSGNIVRELLEHGGRPLAATVRDCVCDLGTTAPQCPLHAVQPATPNEVADIRHRPLRAGLDEEIVVKLIDVFLDRAELLGNDGEKLLEHLVLRRVPHPVDCREQRIKGFRIVTHGNYALAGITVRESGRASSRSSSAPRSSPVMVVRGGAALSAVSSVAAGPRDGTDRDPRPPLPARREWSPPLRSARRTAKTLAP